MPIQFAYFDFMGRGQVSRLLLAYCHLQHNETQYTLAQISQWIKGDRITLNLDFPSLPYLLDGSFKLTQSKAIQRYIILKAKYHHLLGRNNKEKARVDNIDGLLGDVFVRLVQLFLDQKFAENRKAAWQKIQPKLNYIETFIGANQYLLRNISYPDFTLTVIYEYIKQFFPFQFQKWTNIQRVVNNVNSLKQIQNYYESPKAIKKLMFDRRAANPHFHNLRPLNEILTQQILTVEVEIQKTQSIQQPIKIQSPEYQSTTKATQVTEQPSKQINEPQHQVKYQPSPLQPNKQLYSQPINEPQIISLDQAQQIKLEYPQQINLGQTQQINLEQPQHINLGQTQQINLGQKEQINLEQAQQVAISQVIQKVQQTYQQPQNIYMVSELIQKTLFQSKRQQYLNKVEKNNQPVLSHKNQQFLSSIHIPAPVKGQNKQQSSSWIKVDQEKREQPKVNDTIVLGYWGIRGLGQIQRHLLAYCGVQFSQKLYKTQQQWFSGDKLTLGLPFPNLPYLISPQLKLTQSFAINHYIINSSQHSQLLGLTLADQAYVQNFVKVLSDLFKQLRVLCFTEDLHGKLANAMSKKYEHIFLAIQTFVAQKMLTFGYLTLADFYVAEISHYVQRIFPQLYSKNQFWAKIRNKVENNQKIMAYYNRKNSVKGPFMPPSAKISF